MSALLEAMRQVKERASMSKIAARAGVKLQRAGREWIGCCPFHDDRDPSFTVYADDGRWHCFAGCGGGDQADFVIKHYKVPLAEPASDRHAKLRRLLPIRVGACGSSIRCRAIKTSTTSSGGYEVSMSDRLAEAEVFPTAHTGAELLDAIHRFVGYFVAYPSPEAHDAHVLWIVHAHCMDAWESTPRIAFLSPEPGSGKTRALEITELLVPRPVEAVNVTPPYLFRKVAAEEGRPTILFDEIDTIFGPRAKDNEEIRGLLNAGHRRGAVAGRCVVKGRTIETEEIPAYCAVALAGLGDLPDTILTRSIVIRMRRRAPGETVEPYRRRVHAPAGEALRDDIARWASHVQSRLASA